MERFLLIEVCYAIERRGLADYAKAYEGPRFPGVGPERTEASYHYAVFMEIDV